MNRLNGIKDLNISYQFINYSGLNEGENANFLVLSIEYVFDVIKRIAPSKVIIFGYYRDPSITVITPFKDIFLVCLTEEYRWR